MKKKLTLGAKIWIIFGLVIGISIIVSSIYGYFKNEEDIYNTILICMGVTMGLILIILSKLPRCKEKNE